MENEVLKDLSFDPGKGALFFKEVRYLLIRPETLIAFQKAMEKETGEKASELLFQSGFHGGSLSSKKYREVLSLPDEEIVHFMSNMGTQIGWGRFELERFDPAQKVLAIRVHHSPFAIAYGVSPSAVCHFIRGVLSGMATVLFDQESKVSEPECLAKGDEYCSFELMKP